MMAWGVPTFGHHIWTSYLDIIFGSKCYTCGKKISFIQENIVIRIPLAAQTYFVVTLQGKCGIHYT